MYNRHFKIASLIISIVFILHSIYLAVPAEDAFISFRYAKNLISGYGLVWNVGENPVEAYTNFLWIILCSAGLYTGINIIVFSQVLGIISGLFVLLYSYLFCKRVLGFKNYTSLLPPVLLAFSGPLAVWSSSGMEMSLFTLFVLAACYYAALTIKTGNSNLIFLSSIFCLLATLTRPEGLGIFLLLFAFQIVVIIKSKIFRKTYRILIFGFLIYFIPFLIYFVWRLDYYGELLPLTFYAKTGGTVLQWLRGFKYLLFFSFHFILPLFPLLVLFTWEKIGGIEKFSFSIKSLTEERINKYQAIALLSYLSLGYVFYIVFVGGDYMAMYRFFVPVLPMIYILSAEMCKYLIDDLDLIREKKYLLALLIFIAISGTLIQSTPIEKFFFSKPAITHGQYGGVLAERWHVNRLSLIGKFFNEYKNGESESLVTDAIGVISYYSNMKIYGLHGLDDPVIAKMKINNIGSGFPGHEKSDLYRILLKEPTFFMFTRELTKDKMNFPDYSTEINSILRKDYNLKSVWLEDKKNNESGYFSFLQRNNKNKK
ncbi:MAG: hypothetical protein PVF17_05785 [Ignavibacteria bacterium]|jgi:hypothetical protein